MKIGNLPDDLLLLMSEWLDSSVLIITEPEEAV